MEMLGRIREEDTSLNESSVNKNKKPSKRQKANSIVYGDAIHDQKEAYPQKISVITRPYNMIRADQNKPVASAEFPKKNMSTDKVNYNHELHKLLSHHKKVDSFDKNAPLGPRPSSSKSSKFFLNNSLKGFQFKPSGRTHITDSVSKRSPSFSSSQLPTDLPSNKVLKRNNEVLCNKIGGSISNSSRPLFSSHKPHLNKREKALNVKSLHQNTFEDFKAYSYFK